MNLHEYYRMREAGAAPRMIDCTGMGKTLLTESVENDAMSFEDVIANSTASFLEQHGDELDDTKFRMIARLPVAFAEIAAGAGMTTAELIDSLLDPPEGMQEDAQEVLDTIIDGLEMQVAEEIIAEELEGADKRDVEDEKFDQLTTRNKKDILEAVSAAYIRRVAEVMVPKGAISEHRMALSSQPEKLPRNTRDVLRSGYVPGSEGDRAFAALHRVEVWDDPNGNDESVFKGTNIRQATPLIDRSITRSVPLGESPSPWAVQVLPGLRRA